MVLPPAAGWAEAVQQALCAVCPRSQWPHARVWVPHVGAAASLREALAAMGPGLLPEIFSLDDPDTVYAAWGLAPLPPANEWPLQAELWQLLRQQDEALDGDVLVGRAGAMMGTLNLLAEYQVPSRAAEGSVPAYLQSEWQRHAGPLLPLWRRVEDQSHRWLAAGRAAKAWQQVAENFVAVSSGLDFWLGEVPETPTLLALWQRLEATGGRRLEVALPPPQVFVHELPDPWAEVEAAGVWVLQQMQRGATPVAVVASGVLAQRLADWLAARAGVVVTRPGSRCWLETPEGAGLLAHAAGWVRVGGRYAFADWLEGLPQMGLPLPLQNLLMQAAEMEGAWDGAMATAWLRQVLLSPAPAAQRDARVAILPPAQAAWRHWAALWVAELNEGVWPTRGDGGGFSPAQREALGLPTSEVQAQHAERLLAHLGQLASQVVFSRAQHDTDGSELLPSRWWPSGSPRYEPVCCLPPPRAEGVKPLGQWQPQQAPHEISASLLRDILTCPYRGYAARMLKLEALPPLQPEPDPAEAGKLLHRWLEAAARRFPAPTAAQQSALQAWLEEDGARLLAKTDPFTRALWKAKIPVLARVLSARWVSEGRTLEVERRVVQQVGTITFHARLDALADGGAVVLDYKTGTPPALASMRSGAEPQLPLEAWLLAQGAPEQPPEAVEIWQLRGFGAEPLRVDQHAAAALMTPVEASLNAVAERLGAPQATWPALPDNTEELEPEQGHCRLCRFQGICRRMEGGQDA